MGAFTAWLQSRWGEVFVACIVALAFGGIGLRDMVLRHDNQLGRWEAEFLRIQQFMDDGERYTQREGDQADADSKSRDAELKDLLLEYDARRREDRRTIDARDSRNEAVLSEILSRLSALEARQ